MVVKEGSPGLRWRFPVCRTRYLLTLVSPILMPSLRSSPWILGARQAWVLFAHAADQIANFAWDRRAALLAAEDLPRPEEAKRLAVPGNDCFRLHDNERRTPDPVAAGPMSVATRSSIVVARGQLGLEEVEQLNSLAGRGQPTTSSHNRTIIGSGRRHRGLRFATMLSDILIFQTF